MSVDPADGRSKTVSTLTNFNIEWGSAACLDATLRVHYSLLCGVGGGGGCDSAGFHLIEINVDGGTLVRTPLACADAGNCTSSMEAEQLTAER